MAESLIIRFTDEPGDFLELKILGRTNPNSTYYWDANWISIIATVEAGAFSGSVSSTIQIPELAKFHEELSTFYTLLKGKVVFETLEHWIKLEIEAHKMGQIKILGVLRDGVVEGHQLSFTLKTDQTFLNKPIKQLSDVISKFPIIGKHS